MIVDMHTHSSFSDGTLSPSALVKKAREEGVDYLCLTDHDTVGGIDEAVEAGSKEGLGIIAGIELTCSFEGTEFHILGIGIDYKDPAFLKKLDVISNDRSERAGKMAGLLEKHGWEVDLERLYSPDGIITAHDVAGAVTNREIPAFDFHNEWLSKDCHCYVPAKYMPVGDGIRLIRGVGGRAVWAHPLRTLAEAGIENRFPEIAEKMVARGIDGLEVFYGYSPREKVELVYNTAEKYGLLKTGGSDYHGPGHPGRCSLGDYYTHDFDFDAAGLPGRLQPSSVMVPCCP
jgi:hypothetical protein